VGTGKRTEQASGLKGSRNVQDVWVSVSNEKEHKEVEVGQGQVEEKIGMRGLRGTEWESPLTP